MGAFLTTLEQCPRLRSTITTEKLQTFRISFKGILLPGGSAKPGDVPKEIELDPWRTGGKNLFKKVEDGL